MGIHEGAVAELYALQGCGSVGVVDVAKEVELEVWELHEA